MIAEERAFRKFLEILFRVGGNINQVRLGVEDVADALALKLDAADVLLNRVHADIEADAAADAVLTGIRHGRGDDELAGHGVHIGIGVFKFARLFDFDIPRAFAPFPFSVQIAGDQRPCPAVLADVVGVLEFFVGQDAGQHFGPLHRGVVANLGKGRRHGFRVLRLRGQPGFGLVGFGYDIRQEFLLRRFLHRIRGRIVPDDGDDDHHRADHTRQHDEFLLDLHMILSSSVLFRAAPGAKPAKRRTRSQRRRYRKLPEPMPPAPQPCGTGPFHHRSFPFQISIIIILLTFFPYKGN